MCVRAASLVGNRRAIELHPSLSEPSAGEPNIVTEPNSQAGVRNPRRGTSTRGQRGRKGGVAQRRTSQTSFTSTVDPGRRWANKSPHRQLHGKANRGQVRSGHGAMATNATPGGSLGRVVPPGLRRRAGGLRTGPVSRVRTLAATARRPRSALEGNSEPLRTHRYTCDASCVPGVAPPQTRSLGESAAAEPQHLRTQLAAGRATLAAEPQVGPAVVWGRELTIIPMSYL